MNKAIRHSVWRYRLLINLFLGIIAFAPAANAHESRPAYLEIDETAPGRYDVIWRTPLNAGMRLPIALKFSEGVSNVTEPAVRELPDSLVERRIIKVSDSIAGKRIDFVGLQATITDVLVRVRLLDGSESTTVARPHRDSQQLRIAWDRAHCLWHRSSSFCSGSVDYHQRDRAAAENSYGLYSCAQYNSRARDPWYRSHSLAAG